MHKLCKRFLRPIDVLVVSIVGLVAIFVYFNEVFIGILFGLLILDALFSLTSTRD